MAEVITQENGDGSVTTTVIEAGRRYVTTVTPQEAAALAVTLLGGSSVGHCGDVCRSDVGGPCYGIGALARVRDYTAPANFGWDQLTPAVQKKYGNDINRWWKALGKDNRVSSRASFAALKAERPNDTPAEASKWWGSLAVRSRQRLREKYTKGYGDDFFDDVQSVITPIAKVVKEAAPIASLIPGYGPVIAQGIRNGADAAMSITDPKKALAYMAGGEGGLKALALVRGASVSKTLSAAAKDLAAIAPAASGKPAGLGSPASAQQFAATAQSTIARAAKQGGLTAAQAGQLLSQANTARKKILASSATPGPLELADFARRGRVRSSRGGAVTPAELAAAQAAGRVFYVSN
jgi:hypothetical protein